MSEKLTAAASALGVPEALVDRSARARAAELGADYEDVLTQWAGGEAVPAATAERSEPETPAASADTSTETPMEDAVATTTAPEVVIEVLAPAAPPEPVPAGPYRPPVLVGARDNPMSVLVGVFGLFLIVAMVGLVGPSIPGDIPGARTSEIAFSDLALAGRHVYEKTGCASCHTQMVRPVVADVGLGAVTLGDTNQVLGTTRFGPDLSNVGSRVTAAQLEAIVGGLDDHPAHRLGDDDLAALVAYLSESRTLAEEQSG